MNVLFLTVSTGRGHTSCAKAMEKSVKNAGMNTYSLDVFGYSHKFLEKAVSEIYLFASGKTPKLYGKYYDREDYGKGNFVNVVSKFNMAIKNKIERFILENNIDVVVCTHLFAGQLMTMIKENVNTYNIGVVTDYTIHPKWETTDLDCYVIADKLLIPLAVKKGIGEEKLLPIGIPVDEKFSKKGDKTETKKKLGFDDKPLLFVMMGSMGYGNIIQIAQELDSAQGDFNIAIVCGNNEDAYEELTQMKYAHTVKIYGFVNNVDEFMDAAECIITKPGGLSVTESLAKKLPMIYMDPIPGQEERNIEFLVNYGVGLGVSSVHTMSVAVSMFFGDEIRRKEIQDAVKRLSKPDAAENLAEFIAQWGEKNGKE